MTVEWNRVTWYSKLIAVIFFVLTFWTAFYLGTEFEKIAVRNEKNSGIVTDNENPNPKSGDVALKVGQSKTFSDFKITLDSVANDSRCPKDVICIWAGTIEARVTFLFNNTSLKKTLTLGGNAEEFRNYNISIKEVTPETDSKKQIKQSDYIVTFHLEK